MLESGARAVFFSGNPDAGAVALWQQLHAAAPHLRLLGSSSLAEPTFATQIGSAAAHTYLTSPLLALSLYPPPAQRVLAEYRARFHHTAGPYALYGYEAMSAVLLAIHARRASRQRPRDGDPQVLCDPCPRLGARALLGACPTATRRSRRYAVDRVHGRRPVF